MYNLKNKPMHNILSPPTISVCLYEGIIQNTKFSCNTKFVINLPKHFKCLHGTFLKFYIKLHIYLASIQVHFEIVAHSNIILSLIHI